jgi:hypothetical protein
MKKIAAVVMFALFALVTSAQATIITDGAIAIGNQEGTTDFTFAIVEGASGHHAFWFGAPWSLAQGGESYESPTFDWIPLGDYVCLAGQRCVLDGHGMHLTTFWWWEPVTDPAIDFWGRPLATSVPESDTLPLMIAGLVFVWLAAFGGVVLREHGGTDGPTR